MQVDTNKDQRPVFRYDKRYNPYEDPKLVETETSDPVDINTREPFNDVVKYQDIIVGHQRNRTLSEYSRKARPWVRLYAIVILILLIGGFVWDYVH